MSLREMMMVREFYIILQHPVRFNGLIDVYGVKCWNISVNRDYWLLSLYIYPLTCVWLFCCWDEKINKISFINLFVLFWKWQHGIEAILFIIEKFSLICWIVVCCVHFFSPFFSFTHRSYVSVRYCQFRINCEMFLVDV